MIRSRVLALTAFAGILAASGQARAQQQPANPAIEDWKPEKLVNVEILPKTMPADDVIKVMKGFNAALNVDCVFCHKGQVGKPWSTYDFTDTSKKRHEVARLMVKSTIGLNEAFKDLGEADEPVKVSCATCHRRNRHPEITPPAAVPKPEH